MFSVISSATSAKIELNFGQEMPSTEVSNRFKENKPQDHGKVVDSLHAFKGHSTLQTDTSKVKKLCKFFEEIIQKHQARRTFEKQLNLRCNRASCPAYIGKGSTKLKTTLSAQELRNIASEEVLTGPKHGFMPKRAMSLGSISTQTIPEENGADMCTRNNSNIEEFLSDVSQILEREKQDEANDKSGVIGSQEIYSEVDGYV